MDLAKNLKVESVSRLHPTPPWHVRPDQTVTQVVAHIAREVGRLRAGL